MTQHNLDWTEKEVTKLENDIKYVKIAPNGVMAYTYSKGNKLTAVELLTGNVIGEFKLTEGKQEIVFHSIEIVGSVMVVLFSSGGNSSLLQFELSTVSEHLTLKNRFTLASPCSRLEYRNNQFLVSGGLECYSFTPTTNILLKIAEETSKFFLTHLKNHILVAFTDCRLKIKSLEKSLLETDLELKTELIDVVSLENMILLSFKDKYIKFDCKQNIFL